MLVDHRHLRHRSGRRGTSRWGSWSSWMADGDRRQRPVHDHGRRRRACSPTATCAENDNHGGEPEPEGLRRPDRSSRRRPAPATDRRSTTSSTPAATCASPTRCRRCSPAARITFDNSIDAPLENGIWHTITACKAPCNESTGIAYPLADGDVVVRLRRARRRPARRPPAGSTWSTPDGPARRHLHLLLPDPPVHAGRVPGRAGEPALDGRVAARTVRPRRPRASCSSAGGGALVVRPPGRRARRGRSSSTRPTARRRRRRRRPTGRGRCSRARSRTASSATASRSCSAARRSRRPRSAARPTSTGSMTVDGRPSISDVDDRRRTSTTLASDRTARDTTMHDRRARDRTTSRTATFTLTGPIDAAGRAGEGQAVKATVDGRARAARRDASRSRCRSRPAGPAPRSGVRLGADRARRLRHRPGRDADRRDRRPRLARVRARRSCQPDRMTDDAARRVARAVRDQPAAGPLRRRRHPSGVGRARRRSSCPTRRSRSTPGPGR